VVSIILVSTGGKETYMKIRYATYRQNVGGNVKMKTISAQYILGLTLGLLLMPITVGLLKILPDIGWHFLTLAYIIILLFQQIFYYLTTEQRLRWTIVNYIINFVIWTAELVTLEKIFGETGLYNAELSSYYLPVMGGLLWTTNKLIIDRLFRLTNKIELVKSRIDLKFERN
jgi:hypothetical protein